MGSMDSQEARYGAEVTLTPNAFTKEGNRFTGWKIQGEETTTYEDKATISSLTRNITLVAQWASNQANYTVKHFQQDLEGDGYTEVEDDAQTLSGEIGKETKAEVKSYEGFTPKKFEQEEISEDGKTLVKIYYDRKLVTVSYDANGGTGKMEDDTARYGANISLKNNSFVRTGYTFIGWKEGERSYEVGATLSEVKENHVMVAQ